MNNISTKTDCYPDPDEYVEAEITREHIKGKRMYVINVKTIINFASAFGDKLLCDGLTFSLGTACVYSCLYCYVLAIVRKHPEVVKLLQELEKEGLEFRDVVMVRCNALPIMLEQLTTKKPRHIDLLDHKVIYTSPLVDPAPTINMANQTLEACLMIMELTNWTVRLLSKSNLLSHIAKQIPARYRHRFIFGHSTGTLNNRLAAAFERGTPLVSQRIQDQKKVHDMGFRTFNTDGVHQKTLNRLTRFIDQFKQMNFANDAEMAAQLDKVRGELLTRTAAEYRDSRSAQRSLKDGLSALAGKARELAQADSRELVQQFGQLGRRRFHLAA